MHPLLCSHCDSYFVPSLVEGEFVYLDDAGAVCCDECFDHPEPGTSADLDEVDEIDPDHVRDIMIDTLTGV